jgi:hypothetical protein
MTHDGWSARILRCNVPTVSASSVAARDIRRVREMVACKWNYSHPRGPGRPRLMQRIVNLVLRMALENRSVGVHADPRSNGQSGT